MRRRSVGKGEGEGLDLRAPLRHVVGFSRILLEDHAGNLDVEARSYLERIVKATTHMAELTEGLLSLARLAGKRDALGSPSASPQASTHEDESRPFPLPKP